MKQLKLKQIELYGWNYPIRPERAEALSPGHRPGLSYLQTWRPVRAKALKLTRKFIKLLPLQGALLTVTIPRALPWAKSFCPFRACCLYPLPWAMNFWDFSPFQPYSSSDFWRLFESQCIVTTSQIGKCAMVDCFSYIWKCHYYSQILLWDCPSCRIIPSKWGQDTWIWLHLRALREQGNSSER